MREERQSSGTPAIAPGQIWLIEQKPAAPLSPLDRAALTGANVVLYDRALADLVAHALPLWGYAEPLPANSGGAAISPRALHFAAEGWSVVQLVEARPERRPRVTTAAAALMSTTAGCDLPVQIIAKTGADIYRKRDARSPALAELADEFGDEPLTLVFGPLAARPSPSAGTFTANGLAG